MPTVLIIGASRGIGLEFVRQYAAEGARVLATCRQPAHREALRTAGARPYELEVTDPAAVAALAAQLKTEPIDVLVINAGVYGPRTTGLEAPTRDEFDAVMRTNVFASMALIAALGANVAAARGKLAVVSSAMGSTSRMSGPGGWLYRASKAALNNALKAASLELGPQGVVCWAFHPGWVRTDMGGAGADLEPAASVAGMRRVIAAANASHNGRFMNYDGEQIPW